MEINSNNDIQKFYLYASLKSSFNLNMEFLVPIFKNYNNKGYYYQNIKNMNRNCKFESINIDDINMLIIHSKNQNKYTLVSMPVYSFTFDGINAIYGDYKYVSNILNKNLHKIHDTNNIYYDVLIFLRKFKQALEFVKSKRLANINTYERNLYLRLKLTEINKLKKDYYFSLISKFSFLLYYIFLIGIVIFIVKHNYYKQIYDSYKQIYDFYEKIYDFYKRLCNFTDSSINEFKNKLSFSPEGIKCFILLVLFIIVAFVLENVIVLIISKFVLKKILKNFLFYLV